MQKLEEGHFFFSSESVTEGHPDKLCDLLSDSILDACLKQDPNSKVAIESVAKSNMILIAGELSTTAKIDYKKLQFNHLILVKLFMKEKKKKILVLVIKVICSVMLLMKLRNFFHFLI